MFEIKEEEEETAPKESDPDTQKVESLLQKTMNNRMYCRIE